MQRLYINPRFREALANVGLESFEQFVSSAEQGELVAEDKDCSDKYGKVCSYVLESENQPFEISNEGESSRNFRFPTDGSTNF